MKALCCTRCLWSLLVGFAAGLSLMAGEANPPPPSITEVTASNSQHRISWTPYPAAQAYSVLSTPVLGQPFVTNLDGSVSGYDWTGPMPGPAGFHRVQVTPLSSNDLLCATVLNRLTYGPTPDEITRIKQIGPQAYIDEQLASESLPETIDTDPPIINSWPPPPPLSNWIRVSATGTASNTNLFMHMNGAGRVYIDDVRLVVGTNADLGPNLLVNGDFEEPPLTNGWTVGSIYSRSVITNSPTVSGLAASGANCLLMLGTAGGSGGGTSIQQVYSPTNYPANTRFTLSFSYLPVQNPTNTTLTVRLSGSATIRTVTLPPGPPAPPTPPASPNPTYDKLTNGTATLHDLRAWHVLHAVQSKRQLHEILVQFFENHFTTEYAKLKDWFDDNYSNAITNETVRQYLAIDFEWREHTKWRELLLNPSCTFYDLLKVSVESPAMIIYLDTVLNSRSAANENYARELLELHTMGADNGYIQQDIVAMAQVWTGWRVAKKAPENAHNPFAPTVGNVTNDFGDWVLHFNPNSHNTTSNKWLFTNAPVEARFGPPWANRDYSLKINRNQYTGTNGMAEGYLVVQHLANLPQTMEFLSVKLCRLFVHDHFEFGLYDYTAPDLSPEARLIKDCMTAWDTPSDPRLKGNIRDVLRVIFNSDLFRSHAASQQKVKTPLEFAVSAVRALRVVGTNGNSHVLTTADTDGYGISGASGSGNTSPLGRMGGMGLFNRPEPDGFSEFGTIWLNTANLCERMRFAQHLFMASSNPIKSSDYGTPGTRNISDPAQLIRLKLDPSQQNDPAAIVDYLLGLLYPGEGKANLDLDRQAAIQFLTTNDAGAPASFSLSANEGRLRGAVALLMCLPRYQEQ